MKLPDFSFEKKLWRKDFKFVAGIDEVGRGSFAGPVVAGAVAFPENSNYRFPIISNSSEKIIINDSKKLTVKKRQVATSWIKKNALAWGIGEASVSLINRVGIAKATRIAFRKAISEAAARKQSVIDFLLIDAFYIPYVRGIRRKNQLAIINGDEKSVSIAAASIIAKVYRDKIMSSLGKHSMYKKYGWEKNKGYGTRKHREVIENYGITRFHRKVFISTFLQKSQIQISNFK